MNSLREEEPSAKEGLRQQRLLHEPAQSNRRKTGTLCLQGQCQAPGVKEESKCPWIHANMALTGDVGNPGDRWPTQASMGGAR